MAFFAKSTNTKLLSFSMGLSGGVMIYVSFVEILAKSRDYLCACHGHVGGNWMAVGSFFAGIALIAVIDKLIPDFENPHEMHTVGEVNAAVADCNVGKGLLKTGMFTALAIGIHNFPEGLATFSAALTDPHLGLAIAIAIAIHNIPEGIAVSIPIYYATCDRKKAFGLSLLSGLAEPLGALIGYLVLRPFMSESVLGFLFGGVAGIMVYISLDELLPSAEKYGHHHLTIGGIILGMAVMALSLLFFI